MAGDHFPCREAASPGAMRVWAIVDKPGLEVPAGRAARINGGFFHRLCWCELFWPGLWKSVDRQIYSVGLNISSTVS